MKTDLLRTSNVLSNALALSLTALLVTGCNQKHPAATQVVAKVNNDEISVHQVNNALAKTPNVAPENVDKARKLVLDRLINQELAVQQALDQKLDRSPEVMMQMDASRREILTRAYLSQIVAGLPKPSAEETKKFYDEHPQLFAERRIYKVQEIAIPNPHPSAAELQQRIAGKSMIDIAGSLRKDNIAFTGNAGTRAAEQIPLTMLTELAKLKDGQTSVIETPEAALIVHVDGSQLAPVKEEEAMKRIPQFLTNEKAQQVIAEKLQHLKSQAKIEYMNGFAAVPTGAKPDAVGANPRPAADTNTRAVSENKTTTSSIERAISGFK